jgi:2-keto-4-pentenoate hydratase/2-oxohepta-3-ene-1,7-dioic acid hydratase in catechol pathway
MKLVRFGAAGAERPGLIDGRGDLRDLSGHVDDIGPATLGPAVLARLRTLDPASLPRLSAQRLGVPVSGIGKIVGIGLNYADHAAEAGIPVPSEPVIFLKATSSLTGPDDGIVMPSGGRLLDWEAELGVVIGRRATDIAESEALSHIAGYCVVNDVSERAFQLEHGGQWTKGKSADSFCPVGPWLVTADEVPDPQGLDIWLEVNGQRRQASNTGRMVFGVAAIVAYLSRFMTLHPGDLIATGTPAGVGFGMKPQCFLARGDTVRLGVAGLGEQRQTVR